ncbi:MAG: tetratricopeptide repeat protein [Paramuribaculum sp.]|nr:tetratricopeptide repeat protein [Paramuribaculum sp.]
MKFTSILLAAVLATALTANAQTSAESPMTTAVIRVYDKMIEENPSDYETYFARATEYYNQDDYIKALDDVNHALRYAPENAREVRFGAYRLRASINEMRHKYSDALNDINSALAFNPESYSCIQQRANIEFSLGQYTNAKSDYTKLLRAFPHNQEAMFGLSRVAVKENNIGIANDYADRAVDLFPSTAESYIRRASIRTMMGNVEGAVDDYIIALTTDNSSNGKALAALVELANTNYPAVMNGLSRAIRQAPRVGMFYYIRAAIAESHNNYTSAISDYDKILNDKLYSYAGLNSSLAKCFYALGQYDTALANADYAISATPDNAPYFALKANILNALGEPAEALSNIGKALAKEPGLVAALDAKADAQIALGDVSGASVTLAEALLNDPLNSELLMKRAWLCDTKLNQPELAKSIYTKIAELDSDPADVKSLKGFALARIGKDAEADSWITSLLVNQPDTDGTINYYGACYYAEKGSMEKAAECMEKALEKGYANYHNWVDANGSVTVGALRDTPQFKGYMSRFASIFNR